MNPRTVISSEVNFEYKTKQFSFLYENFHVPCHLLISRLKGDGFQSINKYIERLGDMGFTSISLSSNVTGLHKRSVFNLF